MEGWAEKTTTKKGYFGEDIVTEYLKSKRYVVYQPEDPEIAHVVDLLAYSFSKNELIAVEVKAKPEREFFPDTGFDIAVYHQYKKIQEKMDVAVFFVDENSATVYGNFLQRLEIPTKLWLRGKNLSYPLRQHGIIYFPTDNMKIIGQLTLKQVVELKKLSTRDPQYNS